MGISGISAQFIHRKRLWLALYRFSSSALLMVATGAWLSSTGRLTILWENGAWLMVLVAILYLAALILELSRTRESANPGLGYAQVFGDIFLSSYLVFLTGGVDSPLSFTYSMAVVAAAIGTGSRGALFAAAAASLSFIGVTAALWFDLLRGPVERQPMAFDTLAYLWTLHVLAGFLIAALASFLARQLILTGGQLEAREADLKDLVRLQNQIVHSMPSGLMTCDAQGKLTFLNSAAASILGIPLESRGLRSLNELLPAISQIDVKARRAETYIDTPAGRRIVGLTVTPLDDASGAQLIVFQDLTGLRQTEAALRRADHLASLGKVSAQLAHEIRNPLAAMRGAAQMLSSDEALQPDSTRLANIIVRESDRLAVLVEEFLRFARPPPPSRSEINLATLARETLEMLRADPKVAEIRIEHRLEDVQAFVDADQIRQVLINLLRNAFEALLPHGVVRLTLKRFEAQARLSIWDSAGAISPNDLGRIFDPFYTTRSSGTGLGLSTSHSIVHAHGGRILVSSDPKSGTEFIVDLPIRSEISHARAGG